MNRVQQMSQLPLGTSSSRIARTGGNQPGGVVCASPFDEHQVAGARQRRRGLVERTKWMEQLRASGQLRWRGVRRIGASSPSTKASADSARREARNFNLCRRFAPKSGKVGDYQNAAGCGCRSEHFQGCIDTVETRYSRREDAHPARSLHGEHAAWKGGALSIRAAAFAGSTPRAVAAAADAKVGNLPSARRQAAFAGQFPAGSQRFDCTQAKALRYDVQHRADDIRQLRGIRGIANR